MDLSRKQYGLIEVSPLDLMDLLPTGVEVMRFDTFASTVTVLADGGEVDFLFTTEAEVARLGLRSVDACIHTLFKTPKAKAKTKSKQTKAKKKPAVKAGGKSGKR
jgi:hypothetical protein